jgi:hypothetical protein
MLTQLSRRDWPRFFSRLSAALAGRAVPVDTAGFDEELPGGWIGLASVSYDAEREELVLLLEGERRLARHPHQVHVHWDEGLLYSVELVDRDGRRDYLMLRQPLQVPS